MTELASHELGCAFQSSGMLPRRWYTDERAPAPGQAVRLTAQTWRYCALQRRKPEERVVPIAKVIAAVRRARYRAALASTA